MASKNKSIKNLAQLISDSARDSANKTYAVLIFEVIGGRSASYGEYISLRLIQELVNIKSLKIVERSKIKRILKEHEFDQSGWVDVENAAKIGKILSARAVIIGSINIQNTQVEILARVVESESGLIIKTASCTFIDSSLASRKNAAEKSYNKKTPQEYMPANLSQKEKIIPDEEKPQAEVQSISISKHGRSLYINGEIKNSGNVPLKMSGVTFVFYDKKGEQAEVVNAYPSRFIQPKETLPIKGFLKKAPLDYKSYKVVYEPEEETFFTYLVNFKSSKERFSRDKFLGYKLSGTLTNLHEFTVSYPSVIVALYDKNGRFIGSQKGFAAIKKLKSKQSSPYIVHIYKYGLAGIPKSYKLHFSGLRAK